MPNWSEGNLRTQYNRAKANGWLPLFVAAGDSIPDDDVDGATLCALASRETNMQNIRGDFRGGVYHGYSLLQLDIGSHKAWIESGAWRDVGQAIIKGTEALDEKRDEILRGSGKELHAKAGSFRGKAFGPMELKHISLAAYNSGLNAYYSYSVDHDPDKRTTGHDYGRDVLAREVFFRRWMDADGLLGSSVDDTAAVAPPDTRAFPDGGAVAADASATPDAPALPVTQPTSATEVAPAPTPAQPTIGQRLQTSTTFLQSSGIQITSIGGAIIAFFTHPNAPWIMLALICVGGLAYWIYQHGENGRKSAEAAAQAKIRAAESDAQARIEEARKHEPSPEQVEALKAKWEAERGR